MRGSFNRAMKWVLEQIVIVIVIVIGFLLLLIPVRRRAPQARQPGSTNRPG